MTKVSRPAQAAGGLAGRLRPLAPAPRHAGDSSFVQGEAASSGTFLRAASDDEILRVTKKRSLRKQLHGPNVTKGERAAVMERYRAVTGSRKELRLPPGQRDQG
eukprot:1189108-Prorocentrum_minimum.AAC.1